METFFDKELKTKNFGFDKLATMLFFIPVLEASSEKKLKKAFARLKSFLVQQLQRGITIQEDIDLMKGCQNWIMSDPGTNERFEAMDYLFDLQFLND